MVRKWCEVVRKGAQHRKDHRHEGAADRMLPWKVLKLAKHREESPYGAKVAQCGAKRCPTQGGSVLRGVRGAKVFRKALKLAQHREEDPYGAKALQYRAKRFRP